MKRFLGGFLIALIALSPGVAMAAVSMNLLWTDNSSNEDGFAVERRDGPIGASTTYAEIGRAPKNATSFRDTTGLGAGADYCYRVKAFNQAGESAYSNEACGKTLAGPDGAPGSARVETEIIIKITPP